MGNWQDHWLDYYEILGVEFGADLDTIKKKYHELARIYHPDTYKGEDGDKKIKKINEACAVLSDEEERKLYDEAYLNRLNNKYSTNNEETTAENPKYTEEEIKNAYTEEEIRYAKSMALKKIIGEELEKAKIVINAKNELLYEARQGLLDKLKYFKTLKEFMNSANEYLRSLNELQHEAYKYDLLEEQTSILEIKNYLEELLNEMPTNLMDAKIFVKKEFIKEQLEEEIQNESIVVKEALNDVMNFYKGVFKKEISKIEFNQYKEIMLLNLENAVTKLENLLILSKEERKKEILELIGTCNGYLKTAPKKYEDALVLGERLLEQDRIKEFLLSYQETERKLDKIMNIIKKYPLNKKVKVLYEYAKNIINQSDPRQYINNIKTTNNDYDTLYQNELLDEALTISDEATKLFEKTIETSKKEKEIYDNRREKEYNEQLIHYLSDSAFNNMDEIEALKLLDKVTKLLAQDKMINELIYDHEPSNLKKQISEKYIELNRMEEQFDSVYFQINKIINDFNHYNDINPQDKMYLQELESMITKLKVPSLFQSLMLSLSNSSLFVGTLVLTVIFAALENYLWKITVSIALVSQVASIIYNAVEFKNDEQIQTLEAEYNARKDYYDLKEKKYVFSK